MIEKRLPKEYARVPRTDINKYDIIYDVASMPPGVGMNDILQMYYKTGMLIYDSSKGKAPMFHDKKIEKDVQVKTNGSTFGRDLPEQSVEKSK